MNATVVIQARMGSSRLPGKSLAQLGGRPVIDWAVERAASADSVERVIVATSTNPEDDSLAEHVASHGVAQVFRGSSDDVLARYADAIATTDSPVIIRVTGDCPFVQPSLIDQAVETLGDSDYVATDPDGRFPRGFDVEAIRRDALVAAHAEAVDPLEREHVTPFIVRRPERFPPAPLVCPAWARHPEFRLTLDQTEDLDLLRAIVDELDATPSSPLRAELMELLMTRPDLVAINAQVNHNIVK